MLQVELSTLKLVNVNQFPLQCSYWGYTHTHTHTHTHKQALLGPNDSMGAETVWH